MKFTADRLDLIAGLESWHFWFTGRTALVEQLLDWYVPRPVPRVLEIGCGTGAMLRRLQTRRAAQTIGLDRRPEGLARLRRAGPADLLLVRGDAEALPFRDMVCDLAVALDIVEHTDDRRAMGELARALRPGGLAVLTVPALPWLRSARDDRIGHHRRYTRRTLATLVGSAALRVEHMRYYHCLLLPLMIITRLVGRVASGTMAVEERPAAWLNRCLTAVNRWEVRMGRHIRWPWGSTLAVVCRKP